MVEDLTRRGREPGEMRGIESAAAPIGKPKLVPAPKGARVPTPQTEAEKSKVVHIVRRLQEESSRSLARTRQPWLLLSLLACIALPTLLASLYYLLIVADRYASEARFAVRNNEPQAADALGLIAGMPSSQNVSDSYIVADYIVGRDMVDALAQRLPLAEIYRADEADFFSRLGRDVSSEELVEYWQKRVNVFFDPTKNTIAVEVQAFRPEDAQAIAGEVVEVARLLVNELSAQSRRDAVQFAAVEVARAELRVRGAREAMRAFRVAHNELDPAQSAEATLGIAAELEAERSRLASQLASIAGYLADDAPSVQMLRSRIGALDSEIARIQGQISGGTLLRGTSDAGGEAGDGEALADVIGQYQELLLDQEFAEKAYTAAMGSLERARTEANRTQSYLAIFGTPSAAEDAAYPHRGLNILIVFVMASVLWAIGALGFLTIRDHAS
jgi:capsular polysaccharide transport system permease protein